jgi:uncharacterized protein (TIGR04255 family)
MGVPIGLPQVGLDLSRQPDLPDFRNPPLNEVVLGVQFAVPRGYSQIRAGEVWGLFKSDFPLVEEQPPLPPTFEMFGRPQPPQMGFGLITGATHDRFWFLTPSKEELIQFQQDRLLHNWRKIGDETNEYPRFERMIVKFERELQSLQTYFGTLSPQALVINQCELSYINHIPYEPEQQGLADRWFRFLQFGRSAVEDFSATFRRILRDQEGHPFGRLTCEVVPAISTSGKSIIRFGLTTRGRPKSSDVSAALEFLWQGREVIVRTFTDVTTDTAHREWQRIQ